jgi:hypothetical protein
MSDKTVMVPLHEMTNGEIATEAARRERSGDHFHAAKLRAYARCRARFGHDHMEWPPTEVEREGLAHECRDDLALAYFCDFGPATDPVAALAAV